MNDYAGPKFDMVFMDINYSEDNLELSPPQKFLETEFLEKLVVSELNNSAAHDHGICDFQLAMLRQ